MILTPSSSYGDKELHFHDTWSCNVPYKMSSHYHRSTICRSLWLLRRNMCCLASLSHAWTFVLKGNIKIWTHSRKLGTFFHHEVIWHDCLPSNSQGNRTTTSFGYLIAATNMEKAMPNKPRELLYVNRKHWDYLWQPRPLFSWVGLPHYSSMILKTQLVVEDYFHIGFC